MNEQYLKALKNRDIAQETITELEDRFKDEIVEPIEAEPPEIETLKTQVKELQDVIDVLIGGEIVG